MIKPEEYLPYRDDWDSGALGRWIILETWQQDAICALADRYHKVIALKGNTGCGKGAFLGIAAVCHYDVWNDDGIVTITRDKHETAVETTFGEVKRWWQRTAVKPQGVLMDAGVKHKPMHRMTVDCPKSDEGFSGQHTENVAILMDEATAVRRGIHDMALTQARKLIKAANPRVMSGPFRETFPKLNADVDQTIIGDSGPVRCITISGSKCTNVKHGCIQGTSAPIGGITIDGVTFKHGERIPPDAARKVRPIIPGQVCLDMWLGLKNHKDKAWSDCMAEGKFPDSDPEFQLIRQTWLARPVEKHTRWLRLWDIANGKAPRGSNWWVKRKYSPAVIRRLRDMLPVKAFGLDIATGDQEGDDNVLAAGSLKGVRAIHRAQHSKTSAVGVWVIELAKSAYDIDLTAGGVPIGVDMDGSPGVGDWLSEHGVDVVPMRGNDSPDDKKRFGNARAERFGQIADRLDPDGAHDYHVQPNEQSNPMFDRMLDGDVNVWMIPDDSMLIEELAVIEKVFKGSDRFKFWVSPKRGNQIEDNYVKPMRVIYPLTDILHRSPDTSDAVAYLWAASKRGGVDLEQWMSEAWGASEPEPWGNF